MIDLKKGIDGLCDIAVQLGDDNLIWLSKFLRQRIYQPDSYIVVLGETCCGKSTLINSMIGRGILPVSSVPSTGAIIETYIDREAVGPIYGAIYRNATMELLEYDKFCELATIPDPEVARLRVTLPASDIEMSGMRIFDTPGYGSLITDHDEILEEFLPNCDAIIYTVAYRSGVQESDHEFLRKLKEVTRQDIPIYLVINKCPGGVTQDSAQVKAICRNVRALLTSPDMPVFLLPYAQVSGGVFRCPELSLLLERTVSDLNTPRRREELYRFFLSKLGEFADLLRMELERRIRDLQINAEDALFMEERMAQLSEQFKYAVEDIVKPGFAKIRKELPGRIAEARMQIETAVCDEIERQDVGLKDEMVAYTNAHLLPFHTRGETEVLHDYLSVELNELDKEVHDYLNVTIIDFQRDVELRFAGSAAIAGASLMKDAAGKLLNNGLVGYFVKFGGQGGVGAGIANGASHILKRVGDFFGKTFSRETHNTLKHVLAKLGLTSAKTLNTLAAGVVEAASLALDYGTWKTRLSSKVKKGLVKWEEEISSLILEDIGKLEKENIDTISGIAKMYEESFSVKENPEGNINELQDMLNRLEKVEEELKNG